jgi:hypothetical protein
MTKERVHGSKHEHELLLLLLLLLLHVQAAELSWYGCWVQLHRCVDTVVCEGAATAAAAAAVAPYWRDVLFCQRVI